MPRLAKYKILNLNPAPQAPLTARQKTQDPNWKTPEHGIVDIHGQIKIMTPAEIRLRILNCMARRHYDPIIELVEMATARADDGITFIHPPEFRKDIHLQLAQFIAPKLKSQEIQIEGDMKLEITVQHFGTPGETPVKRAETVEQPGEVTDV